MPGSFCIDRLAAVLCRAMDSHTQEEDSTSTLAVSASVTGVALICVALRFFVRIRMKVHVGWDDWFILIAMLVTLLEGGLILAGMISCRSLDSSIWLPSPFPNSMSRREWD